MHERRAKVRSNTRLGWVVEILDAKGTARQVIRFDRLAHAHFIEEALNDAFEAEGRLIAEKL